MIPKEQFEGGLAGPFSGKVLVVINKAIPILDVADQIDVVGDSQIITV